MNQGLKDRVWLIFTKQLGMETNREDERFEKMMSAGTVEKRLFDEGLGGSAYLERKACLAGIDVEKELQRVMFPSKRKFLRGVVLKWTAAVLLPLLLGGVFVYYYVEQKPLVVAVDGYKMKQGRGATLVLSDGSCQELFSDSNHIEEKDGSKIKLDSCQLNYLHQERHASSSKLIYNKLIVGRGHEYMLVLSDGTEVWLNSASELQYPVIFGQEERRVKLSGEAYFEVTKDGDRPFIVEVDKGFDVKVLGTHFNIKAYDTDDEFETTLVEGKVEVRFIHGPGVVLKPSEQMVVGRDGTQEVRVVNTDYYTAWHDGWFYFDNEDLVQVLNIIGRWYNIDFVFDDPALQEIKVTGKVKRFENLGVIFEMLTITTGIHYELGDKVVKVYK